MIDAIIGLLLGLIIGAGCALNEHAHSAGDGAGADDNFELRIEAHNASEILLFDLAVVIP